MSVRSSHTARTILPQTALSLLFLLLVAATSFPPRPDGIVPPAVESVTAHIMLQTQSFDSDDWAVVQWQDAQGEWHDVNGWQGNFLGDGTIVWWVSAEHLGQENFRWIVFEDANRGGWKVWSDTFDLPSHTKEVVVVRLH